MINKIKNLILLFILLGCSMSKTIAQKEVLNLSNSNYSEQELNNILKKHSSLKELNLSNSNLTSIPQGVFDLIDLRLLYLDNNRINNIPSEISKLKSLRTISASGNHITNVSSEVLEMGALKNVILKGKYNRGEIEVIKSKFCKQVRLVFYSELPGEYGLVD
jgi:Leucine-rich repeat (LRR) protein